MLDPKFIRDNLELIKEGARKKHVKVDIDRFVELDDKRKSLQSELDTKRAEQNIATKNISLAVDHQREKMIPDISDLKTTIQKLEQDLKPILEEWNSILMNIPNPPSLKMPEGKSDEDNVTIRTWGEIPKFDFEPKTHEVLGKELDIIDIEKATEVTGSRFYYLKGGLVLMQFALTMFAFETLTNEDILKKVIKEKGLNLSSKPFVPMLPPVMIKNTVQSSIHRVFGEQTYKIKDEENLNLVASAEHTMALYHMNEALNEEELPKRYIGYSTAFRKEAGTYGKDMKGFFRCHQFDKSEMESFTTAETGEDEQEMIVGLQEYMMQQLEIPYRVQQICTGDTGKPDYQQYDIECWLPGQGKYRETHTSDYMTDFQTHGIKSFHKTKDGEKKLLHTNDATAFAGRPMIAIMENYQTKNGEIVIPEVLRKYMGGKSVIKK
ncbi:MAG: serine--tRNA ligase [Candidatus Harrisonbacteria bacterium CG10_big_fil_rev_8_21_14_0_10_42_17]|uniref:Serine--tRNA ligase n=1 Tax=Candidatus Harrisonbacteria bacterium CG10_big_fil_rev_8_21_14_0_10_42_17 TaxID=1974584 RepID=A0A2M6WHD7_9BACT|nr:MAG: serine--tRNA ligase [Candidatus Harrisonbacteria bacterium CG10_big_fil_rev_8_21_14_0_10_42_17]